MKIAIIGTRGIPNFYGGFEQFAEFLSVGLVGKGHSVTVYNSDKHPYKKDVWNGVDIVHCYDPEGKIGTVGQFVYDFNCILDTRSKNFDIILQLGYTSSSIWGWFLPRKKSIVTTNMDGLEWKRTKYSNSTQRFLKYAEHLGVKFSDHLISDSIGIQEYLKKKYSIDSTFIPYGANLFKSPDKNVIAKYKLCAYQYNMLVARLEPENSIEIILDGVVQSGHLPFLVVGNHDTVYGRFLKEKYSSSTSIRFIGSLYDINVLNNLRHFSNLYFHGHTVGGTNPSLLEAMSSQALICANNNIFNKSILKDNAFYFDTYLDVASLLSVTKADHGIKISMNENEIINTYSWPRIIDQYEAHFKSLLGMQQ